MRYTGDTTHPALRSDSSSHRSDFVWQKAISFVLVANETCRMSSRTEQTWMTRYIFAEGDDELDDAGTCRLRVWRLSVDDAAWSMYNVRYLYQTLLFHFDMVSSTLNINCNFITGSCPCFLANRLIVCFYQQGVGFRIAISRRVSTYKSSI